MYDIDTIKQARNELFGKAATNTQKTQIVKAAKAAMKAVEAGASDEEVEGLVDQMLAIDLSAPEEPIADPDSDSPMDPKPVDLKGTGDLEHAKQIGIDSINSGMKGSISNVRQKLSGPLEKILTPEEFAKFQEEIAAYINKGKLLVKALEQADSIGVVTQLRKIAKSYTDWARNELHGKAKDVLKSNGQNGWVRSGEVVEPSPEDPAPEAPEQTVDDVNQNIDQWFSDQGIDINDFVVLDPEDPELAGFAETMRNIMSESFDISYKEATKKLL